MLDFQPSYLIPANHSRLAAKARLARDSMENCYLCPRQCGVNRIEGETGYCRTSDMAAISGYDAHFGEETPLVGRQGSGTIFFSHCNLLCSFCQNYQISHLGEGHPADAEQLAGCMLTLQEMGCHNINFVSPSHVVPQILFAVEIAAQKGLRLPLIYNTGGYDSVETLHLLAGVIDIYMPDFKFWDTQTAKRLCNAPDYRQVVMAAITEMHRQVGDLVIDADGIARRGLLIRHLVLPDGMAGTREVMGFIVENISPHTYVNIMSQYHPCGTAADTSELSRPITRAEFEGAVQTAQNLGLTRLDQRRRIFLMY